MLRSHYLDTASTYENQLVSMISALNEGASVYSMEQLSIPAVQHLTGVFKLEEEQTHLSSFDIHGVVDEYIRHASGLGSIHDIVSHTSELAYNAKRRLACHSYNAVLFDFFMQDTIREHLQHMGTSSEDPLERYRRFSIVLDAVISKLDTL